MPKHRDDRTAAAHRRTGEDAERVFLAIEDHIAETHRIPDVVDLVNRSEISQSRVRQALTRLGKEGTVTEVYSRPRVITLYAPSYMVSELLSLQPKPDWVSDYSFAGRRELEKRIRKAKERLSRYDVFERLLYGTDFALQEAVAIALDRVGFKAVKHHEDRNDYADVTFRASALKYLVEVKGKGGQANKDDVLQLDGWMKLEIAEGADPDAIRGMLAINHQRHVRPDQRSLAPLTNDAERFRKHYGFQLLTTPELFELAKEVEEGSRTAMSARSRIVRAEGERK